MPQKSKVLDTWNQRRGALRGREQGRMELQDVKGKFILLLTFLRLKKERKHVLSSPSLLKDLLHSESNIWAFY